MKPPYGSSVAFAPGAPAKRKAGSIVPPIEARRTASKNAPGVGQGSGSRARRGGPTDMCAGMSTPSGAAASERQIRRHVAARDVVRRDRGAHQQLAQLG